MRYLLDTCVLVSAFRSRQGASHALLRRILAGEIRLVMHHKLLAEYQAVLARQCLNFSEGVTWEDAEKVLARLVADSNAIDVRYLWRPNLRDEGDNFVLEIAVAASPCTVVTHNVRDFLSGELRFAGVHILTPQEVLRGLTH